MQDNISASHKLCGRHVCVNTHTFRPVKVCIRTGN